MTLRIIFNTAQSATMTLVAYWEEFVKDTENRPKNQFYLSKLKRLHRAIIWI